MADQSVGARKELLKSKTSQALMFCFDNAFPERFCFLVELVCFISLCCVNSTLGARGFFFRSEAAIVSGEDAIAILPREKKTLWTRQLPTSLPCDFESKHLTKPVFAGSVYFCN